MSGVAIDETERARIVEAYDREMQNKLPTDYSPVARAVAILLVILAIALPKIPGAQHLPRLPILIGLIVGAVVAWFVGKVNLAESEALARAEKAIQRLGGEFPTMSGEDRRQCAVAVLAYAYFSGGPYMRTVVDSEALPKRLGESAMYVEAVEQVLVSERKVYRVLTPYPERKQAEVPWKQD